MPLMPFLSDDIPAFAYDRNGLGSSEIDTTLITDVDVAVRLHDLLGELGIKPPYILAGHSIGGALIRMQAATFPEGEVAGLFFIDPTDFMLTKEDDEQVRIKSDSKIGYYGFTSISLAEKAANESIPAGIRQEMIRFSNGNQQGYFYEYRSLPALKDIPVAVLIAYNQPLGARDLDMAKQLGVNLVPWFEEVNKFRIINFARMIENNQLSYMVLLPRYSHGIHHQDPKLVANYLNLLHKATMTSPAR